MKSTNLFQHLHDTLPELTPGIHGVINFLLLSCIGKKIILKDLNDSEIH